MVGLAEYARIELRRIRDVLDVDHASLHLRDPDDPRRAVAVAEAGRPIGDLLAGHAGVVARVLRTGRVEELHELGETTCAALATPLEHDGRTFGTLLIVTLRRNRRLGATEAQVIGRATETLVERIGPTGRFGRGVRR
jgi:hypothetical protein